MLIKGGEMVKNFIGNLLARLLRAALGRLASDIDLARSIKSVFSTVTFIDSKLMNSKIVSSRKEIMDVAFDNVVVEGFICELGVYKGDSLNEIARYFSSSEIHGFDTFTGLPEFWREGFPEGAFDVALEKLSFEKNCVLHKGLFDVTLPIFLEKVDGFARLIHVDCDLYSSTATALEILAPCINVGTVLIFDEYFNYPGWEMHEHKAFQEFLELHQFDCKYLAYNKLGEQVVVVITKENLK